MCGRMIGRGCCMKMLLVVIRLRECVYKARKVFCDREKHVIITRGREVCSARMRNVLQEGIVVLQERRRLILHHSGTHMMRGRNMYWKEWMCCKRREG